MDETSEETPQRPQDIRNIPDRLKGTRPPLDGYLNTNDRAQDIDQIRDRIQTQRDFNSLPESRMTAEDRAFDNNSFNESLSSTQGVRRQPNRFPHAMQVMHQGLELQETANPLENDFESMSLQLDRDKGNQARDFSYFNPSGIQSGNTGFEGMGRGQRGYSAPPSGRGMERFNVDNMSGKWSTVRQESVAKPYVPRTVHPDKFGKQLINFQLDVGDLNPEELEIKTSPQRRVYIRGIRHGTEEGKPVFREYRNSVKIPDNVDINELKSVLTPDGLLRFTAPLINPPMQPPGTSRGPRSQDVEIKIKKM